MKKMFTIFFLIKVLDNGDLQITNALKTDEGMYICSASNKLGDAQARGKLEVKGKNINHHPKLLINSIFFLIIKKYRISYLEKKLSSL